MRRVVSLFLPTWPTDRHRRKSGKPPPKTPLVMALSERGRRIIASVDDAARAAGLTPGMTITKARSLCSDLVAHDADVEADNAGLHRLALWAGKRYSPFVAPDPPSGIWIDITGCEHRFGSERALLRDMFRRVSQAGYKVEIAAADTAGCAHATARYVPAGRPTSIEPGHAKNAMLLLPVAALRIEAGVATELSRMGFTRVEQLMSSPRGPLAKRFGKQLFRRLDQALGQLPEPIEPVFPPTISYARRRLLEPIGTTDAFVQVINDLTKDLSLKLEDEGQGARRLDLYFERVNGKRAQFNVGTATPSRDPSHLAKLLCQRLDRVDAGLGIEVMTLVASMTDVLRSRAIAELVGSNRREPDLASLVDTLANRFGPNNLYRMAAKPSTMPERGLHCIPALSKPSDTGWDDDLPRPSRMIIPPERVEVTAMLPDHPPALFVWRGKRYRIARGDGPERLHGEWWQGEGQEADVPHGVRDYFQVETTEGGRYWLFRLGDGEHQVTGPMHWYIHGAFA